MWYYSINDTQQGPVDEAAIPHLLADGTINAASLVWCPGMEAWLPLSQTGLARFQVQAVVQSPNWAAPPYAPPPRQPQAFNPYLPPKAAPRPLYAPPVAPMTWSKILWSFEGRIPRRTYWAAIGIWIAILAVGGVIVGVVISNSDSHNEAVFPIFLLTAVVPYFWSHLAIQVKRWHDRDKSGAMVLINLIPYIGGIWTFIECGCLRGSVGHNRYGYDPT